MMTIVILQSTHHEIDIKPIADRVAGNLEIIQFGTRRTSIFMGLIIGTMLLLPGTNRKSHVQNFGSLKQF